MVEHVSSGQFFVDPFFLIQKACVSMRADMAKVIVERPRFGSRLPSRKKGYRKMLQLMGDQLPAREPMLGHWGGKERSFNEHLGPMRRYLRSQIGRPWNKVHQDLCEYVSFDCVVQKHVLTHVDDYVQRLVSRVDGRICYAEGYRRSLELRPGAMYVCPESGLLKAVPPTRKRLAIQKVMGAGLVQFLLRDNLWWEVRLRNLPPSPGDLWDAWLEKSVGSITQTECRDSYGGSLMAISKRLLKPAEVKALYRRLRHQRVR